MWRIPVHTSLELRWPDRGPSDPEARFWEAVFDPAGFQAAAGRRPHHGFWVCGWTDKGTRIPREDAVPGPAVDFCYIDIDRRVEFRQADGTSAHAVLRVTVAPGLEWRVWLPPVEDRRLMRAFYKLLRAWPSGWKAIELGLLRHAVLLVPDLRQVPTGLASHPEIAQAVVWTALVRVINGRDPHEAIRQAHTEPELALAASAKGVRPRGRSVDLRAWRAWKVWEGAVSIWPRGPVALPPEYAWLFRIADRPPGQYPLLVDGFWVDVADRPLRHTFYDEPTCRPLARDGDGGWLYAGYLFRTQFRANPTCGPLGGVVMFSCRAPFDEWPSQDLASQAEEEHLATVLRAWPPGQKLLLLDAQAWQDVEYGSPDEIGLVAVRTADGNPDTARVVLRLAVREAVRGATFHDLRRWLARMDARDLEGLRALERLAW